MAKLVISLKLHIQMDKKKRLVVLQFARYQIANCQTAIDVVISKILHQKSIAIKNYLF